MHELGSEGELLNVIACSECSGLVTRSGHLASFKIHPNAFIQVQTADIRGRVPTLGSSASLVMFPPSNENGEPRAALSPSLSPPPPSRSRWPL